MKKYLLVLSLIFIAMGIFAKEGTYSGGGNGTSEEEAIEISTTVDLVELSNTSTDWNLYFKLTSNISFNVDETLEDWNGDGSPDGADPAGFSPIGNDRTKFTGTFDGQGYEISNLYINRRDTEDIGLFGYISAAAIENIGILQGEITGKNYVGGIVGHSSSASISDSYTTGNVEGNSALGGIVGFNYSSSVVSNCYATGNVDGYSGLGGLIGHNSSSFISNSYATGNVKGRGSIVGGLVGENSYVSSISNSYATGNVTGRDYVGGLAGNNISSSISNSYAAGNVEGTHNYAGGLVGYNNSSSISNSYAMGNISGTSNVGGFIGLYNSGTLSSNYWCKDVSFNSDLFDIGDDGDNPNIYAKTYTKMQTKSTYNDWDFETIWGIDANINNNYPFLKTLKVE